MTKRPFSGCLLLLLLWAAPVYASSIHGTVALAKDASTEATVIQLLTSDGTVIAEVTADAQGRFELGDTPEGRYFVQARTPSRVSPLTLVEHSDKATEMEVRFSERLREPDLDREMVSLQNRLSALQAELAGLIEKRAANPAETAEPEPQVRTTAEPQLASLDVPPSLAFSLAQGQNNDQDSLYPLRAAGAQIDSGESAAAKQDRPASLPGRAYGNKGLYQGLASGAPDQRYGRGIFSDYVRVGGYGSFRYQTDNIDNGPQIGDLPALKRSNSGFDFRRFVFTLDAAPSKRLRFYTEVEFERLNEIEIERAAIPENRGRLARNRQGTRFIQEVEGTSGGEIAIEQAWMEYKFTENFSSRFGVVLPPVGRYNILHDDDYWDLPRRPLSVTGGPATPVKAAWREMGAGLLFSKPIGQGYLDGQFYFVNGAQLDFSLEQVAALREGRNLIEIEPEIAFSSGAFDGSQTADAFTWRLAASPKVGHEIAVSAYHGRYTPDYLRQNAWVNTLALDGKTTLGRFEVEGELIYTKFNRFDKVLDDFALQLVDVGAATSSAETASLETEIEAEFAGPLTRARKGFWLDLKYRLTPDWLRSSFLGREFEDPQLIPILRWERLWFDDFVSGFDFAGGVVTEMEKQNLQQERVSLGLAYRPITSVVITGAWEHNRRVNGNQLIFPRRVGFDPFTDRSFDTFIVGAAFGF